MHGPLLTGGCMRTCYGVWVCYYYYWIGNDRDIEEEKRECKGMLGSRCWRCVKWRRRRETCFLLLLLCLLAPCLRFEQSRSLSSPAILPSPLSYTLSYTGLSLFIYLCTLSYEPSRHHHHTSFLHLLLVHYRFLRSLGSSSIHFFFLYVHLSIYHMAATVRQPKPTKKGFPGDNSSTRSVLPPSHFASPADIVTIP